MPSRSDARNGPVMLEEPPTVTTMVDKDGNEYVLRKKSTSIDWTGMVSDQTRDDIGLAWTVARRIGTAGTTAAQLMANAWLTYAEQRLNPFPASSSTWSEPTDNRKKRRDRARDDDEL